EDGKADVLVLSHNGQPVFEKWAHQDAGAFTSPANAASDDSGLISLADPFVGDLTMRGTRPWRAVHRDSLLSTSGGLPLPATAISSVRSSVRTPESAFQSSSRLAVAQASPRGPPVFSQHQ